MKKYLALLLIAALAVLPFQYRTEAALTVDQILNNVYDSTETALKFYMIYDEVIGDFTVDTTTFHVDSANNKVGIGTITPDNELEVRAATALTNTVSYPVKIMHGSSGTEAAGIGVGIQFDQDTSGSNEEIVATIEAVTTDVTGATEDADFLVKLMAGGSAVAEKLRVASTGVLTLVNSGTISNAVNGIITVDEPSAATNAVVNTFKVSHTTSGTPAAGIGTGIAMETETSAGNNEVGVVLEAVADDDTAATEDFSFVISNMTGGAAATEKWSIDSLGITEQSGATGSLKTFVYEADALADDASVSLPDATNGVVTVGCNAEMLQAVVANDGSVVLSGGVTANTAATDSDGNLCVFDGGTSVTVRNRLAANCNIIIHYVYDD